MLEFIKRNLQLLKLIGALGLVVILFVTGLSPEIFGGIQRLMLAAGVRNAEVPVSQIEVDSLTYEAKGYAHDLKLESLKGERVNLSSLEGKIVFLNIWASWCPPCIAEMPSIQKLYDSVDQSKIALVMLSVDENQQKARKFIARKEFTFPVYFLAGDLPQAFHSGSIPTTFILGKDGTVLHRHEGMANYDTDKYRRYLKSLAR